MKRPLLRSVATRVLAVVVGAAALSAAATTLIAAALVQDDKEASLFQETVARAERLRAEIDQRVALTEAELRSVALAGERGRLMEVPRLVSGDIEALTCRREGEELVRAAADTAAAAALDEAVRRAPSPGASIASPHQLLVIIRQGDVDAAALLDVADLLSAPGGWVVTLEPPSARASEDAAVTATLAVSDGEDRLSALAPGTPSVRVDAPLLPARRAASELTRRVLLYSIAALLPVVLLGFLVARTVTRPVLALAAAVRARRLPFGMPPLNDDEIGDLGHAIASMSKRLSDDAAELRRAVDFARGVARFAEPADIRAGLRQALTEAVPSIQWWVVGPDDAETLPPEAGLSAEALARRFAAPRPNDSSRPPASRERSSEVELPRDPRPAEPFVTSLFGTRNCEAVVVGRGALDEHARSIVQLLSRIAQSALRTGELTRDILENEKLAVLGRLAAGVTHEVNNPLTFVLTNVTLLEAELTGELKEAASDARLGVERVARIVRDLSSLARGGARLELRAVDLAELGRSAVKVARARRPGVSVVLGEMQRATARCDAGRIEQILVNLLANAVDAAAGAASPRVEVRLLDDDAVARFSISDNGPGIPPSVERRMFEPFFSTKREEGTGLGLFVSRALARSHGGDVAVVRTGPEGTVIELVLPIIPISDAVVPGPTVLAGRPRVLVVDDEPAIVQGLARLLEPRAEVVATIDVETALDAVQARAFDLVLLDVNMPAMRGPELGARMRELRPELEGRVRLMSGSPEHGVVGEVLEKPLSSATLEALLLEHAGEHAVVEARGTPAGGFPYQRP